MLQILLKILSLCLLALSGLAVAAPNKIEVVYEATRNGQPFATITESFSQKNGRYRIESVTKGLGAYVLLGERRLTSEGAVTADGLKPSHFELHQGGRAKKSLFTDFDWKANTLTMKIKGKLKTVPLEKGAQDLSSFIYQFMFAPPTGNDFVLPVTTGKKLNTYHYKVTERGAPLAVPAGKFKTIHLVNADKDAAEDQKELWLGVESHSLPVRLMMRDETGAEIEQALISLHAE